ncbi:MAG TPA: hypothetical protein VFC67_14150 [Prolixibacteraceae bacterium]|nr:hypothetical protein [Prolixibacteraceae bacterium]
MDRKEKTFYEMLKEAVSYARKNESVWMKLAVIAANVELLEENERQLDLAFKTQDENDPSGYVDQKNQQLTVFLRKIYKLDRKLSFYAKKNGDKVLLNDVDVAESTLEQTPEKEALIICSTILKRGTEYLSKTADYGITIDELENLTDELSVLEKMQPTIGIIMNDRKSAGRSIKDLIAEARILLDKQDDAFEGMINDGAFIDGWFAVRKIKGRHQPNVKNDKGTSENN